MITYRIVTWNILEGLLHPRDETGIRKTDHQRLEAAQSLISDLNPDILVLNEALHAEEVFGQIVDYRKIFGFPYISTHMYDGSWGNAILSKHKIHYEIKQEIHRSGSKQNRGALAANISLGNRMVWIGTLHPHPHRRPKMRLQDFHLFLLELSGDVILAGDFNAIYPKDPYSRPKLISAFERFMAPGVAEPSVDRMIEAGFMFHDLIPNFKLRDLAPPPHNATMEEIMTIPTALLGPDKSSAMRIDYILGSDQIKPVLSRTIHDPRADIASDHYPVMVDFEVSSIDA